jgi:hypothetical protein
MAVNCFFQVLMSYISSSVGGDDLVKLYADAFGALESGGAVFVHDFMVEIGLYPIFTLQYSSTTLYQISDHIQSLFY